MNLTTRDFPSKSSEGRQPELFPAVSPAMLGNHDTHHGPNFHLEFLGRAFLGIWRHVSQQGRRLQTVHIVRPSLPAGSRSISFKRLTPARTAFRAE